MPTATAPAPSQLSASPRLIPLISVPSPTGDSPAVGSPPTALPSAPGASPAPAPTAAPARGPRGREGGPTGRPDGPSLLSPPPARAPPRAQACRLPPGLQATGVPATLRSGSLALSHQARPWPPLGFQRDWDCPGRPLSPGPPAARPPSRAGEESVGRGSRLPGGRGEAEPATPSPLPGGRCPREPLSSVCPGVPVGTAPSSSAASGRFGTPPPPPPARGAGRWGAGGGESRELAPRTRLLPPAPTEKAGLWRPHLKGPPGVPRTGAGSLGREGTLGHLVGSPPPQVCWSGPGPRCQGVGLPGQLWLPGHLRAPWSAEARGTRMRTMRTHLH